ncbi:hypothetical protein BgiMline_025080, partial [Biomphalaria glabrata]
MKFNIHLTPEGSAGKSAVCSHLTNCHDDKLCKKVSLCNTDDIRATSGSNNMEKLCT